MNRGKTQLTSSIVVGVMLLSTFVAPLSIGQNPIEESDGFPDGWSDDVNLGNNLLDDLNSNIVVENNNVYAVWPQYNDSPNQFYIVYCNSSDGGKTWTPCQNLTNSKLDTFSCYTSASGGKVNVVWDYINYTDSLFRIFFKNSIDGTETWSSEKQISEETGFTARSPRVYSNDSNIHIIWMDRRDSSDYDIYYRRSIDGGLTFDNGQGLDQDRRITFPSNSLGNDIQIAGAGSNISIVWNQFDGNDFEVHWAISKDNGYTWENGLGTPNTSRMLTDNNELCQDPKIAVNGTNIHIMWLEGEWFYPYCNIYYINSTDNGVTWNGPQLLTGPYTGVGYYNIGVCEDNVYVFWSDDSVDDNHQIYMKNSTDAGLTWSADNVLTDNTTDKFSPFVAISNEAIHLVYQWDYNKMYKRFPDFPPDPTYNITLNEGWNLISTPLIQRDESIDKALANITGKWDYILVYDSADGTDHWKTTATYKPSQLNDLTLLDHKKGFWINITEPGGCNLTLSGLIPETTQIQLKAGWNLVGYPTQTPETVANALWGTGADKVEKFNASALYNLQKVGSSYVMKPGEGYWVHVPADTIWVIDW